MKKIHLFAFGAAYGLLMRLVFGLAPFLSTEYRNAGSGPMLTSFVVLVPLVLGIYTVYGARDDAPTSDAGSLGRGPFTRPRRLSRVSRGVGDSGGEPIVRFR